MGEGWGGALKVICQTLVSLSLTHSLRERGRSWWSPPPNTPGFESHNAGPAARRPPREGVAFASPGLDLRTSPDPRDG